jgi:predicted nucleic acid-binding protein
MEVAVPEEVERECCGAKKTVDSLMIRKTIDESRIRARAIKNKKLVAKVEADFSLGRGEAEAIALAVKEKAQLLCIDDKQGINACKLMRIPFATAVGILLRCREKRLIDRESALSKLATLATYGRYKDAIIEDARMKLGVRE